MSNAARICVLITSADPSLLRTRGMILEQAGFDVISSEPEEALSKLGQRFGDIEGAVLGPSSTLGRQVALAHQMRELSPNLAIVVIYPPYDSFDASDCDAVVETLNGPEALVRAVRLALKKRQSSAA